MKKFNLEDALAGHKVVTRSLEEVTQLTLFEGTRSHSPLVGVVGFPTCNGAISFWSTQGHASEFFECNDLFMGD